MERNISFSCSPPPLNEGEKHNSKRNRRKGRDVDENPKAEAASHVRLQEATAAAGSVLGFRALRSELGFLLPAKPGREGQESTSWQTVCICSIH